MNYLRIERIHCMACGESTGPIQIKQPKPISYRFVCTHCGASDSYKLKGVKTEGQVVVK